MRRVSTMLEEVTRELSSRGAAILNRIGQASRGPSIPHPPRKPNCNPPLLEMNPDELLHFYQINDPIYQGLVRWRIESLQQWKSAFISDCIRILEIGTGHFPFALALGPDTHQMEYVGVEPDPGFNERARLHVKDKFKNAALHAQRWEERLIVEQGWRESFDVVCSFEVFEHVKAEERFIQNACTVLRPGGFLILETPNADVTPLFVKVFNHAPDGGGQYQDVDHVNERGFRDLFQDIRKEGFEIIDFACYYLPVTLWDEKQIEPFQQQQLYQLIHRAAGQFPFYSYAQMFLAQKKG